MRKLIWLIILLGNLSWAQDIQSIVERNPFDPNRGKQETEEPEEEEIIEEVEPEELPILDGTMVFGSTRIAIFSFEQNGVNVSARVEMLNDRDYLLYMREEKASARPEPALPGRRPPRTRRLERTRNRTGPVSGRMEEQEAASDISREPVRNGKVAGYRVAGIAHDHVFIEADGNRIKLEMFREDVDKSRGGTKKAVAKKPATKPLPRPAPRRPTPPVNRDRVETQAKKKAAKETEKKEENKLTEEIKKKF